MLQKLDVNKPAKEILIDKFNAKSGISLDYDHVELGAVLALALPNSKEDTSVELVPTTVAPHLNLFRLRYLRMKLVDIFSAPYLFVPSHGYTTLYELLDDVNSVVGIHLTTDDVQDAPIVIDPLDLQSPVKVFIKAKPTSVLYQGEVTLTLDASINVPTTVVESSSTLFLVNKNTTGLDFITAKTFDGFNSKAFKHLRNIELITKCKIDSIFSCEGQLIVVTGEFQMVAPQLSFISAAKVYKTITMQRDGALVSAREDMSLLGRVNQKQVSVNPAKQVFYVADPQAVIGDNPKNVYRLFQNGTVDTTFAFDLLPSGIVRALPANEGFFTISLAGDVYTVSKHLDNCQEDQQFTAVTIKADKATVTAITGFAYFDEFGHETLTLYMPNAYNDAGHAPTFTAATINHFVSPVPAHFYSPVFSIHDNGATVNASGIEATYNKPALLLDTKVCSQLVKAHTGLSAIYTKDSFGIYNFDTIVPLLLGENKEVSAEMMTVDNTGEVINITEIVKVYQIHSGYETYAVVKYKNSADLACTGVLSFDVNHKCNGWISLSTIPNVRISDVVALRL